MSRLRSCPSCTRHVFAGERRCPFCEAALEPAPLSRRLGIKAGMSRAQRFALGAALLGQPLAGCDAFDEQPEESGTPVPVYGAPIPAGFGGIGMRPPGGAGAPGVGGAAGAGGSIAPRVDAGPNAPIDAGADAGTDDDAGSDDGEDAG